MRPFWLFAGRIVYGRPQGEVWKIIDGDLKDVLGLRESLRTGKGSSLRVQLIKLENYGRVRRPIYGAQEITMTVERRPLLKRQVGRTGD